MKQWYEEIINFVESNPIITLVIAICIVILFASIKVKNSMKTKNGDNIIGNNVMKAGRDVNNQK